MFFVGHFSILFSFKVKNFFLNYVFSILTLFLFTVFFHNARGHYGEISAHGPRCGAPFAHP